MESLKDKIEIIKKWVSEKNLYIFEGDVSDKIEEVEWELYSETSLNDFLNFVDKIKPNFIISSSAKFSYEEIEIRAKNSFKNLEEESKREANLLLKSIKKYDNEIMQFKFGFIQDGIFYSYQNIADWFESVAELEDFIKDGKFGDYFEENILSKDGFFEYAKRLSNDKLFQAAQNKSMREYAAHLFFKENRSKDIKYYNPGDIIDMAQGICKFRNKDFN